eukprot:scaffold7.g3701.t1
MDAGSAHGGGASEDAALGGEEPGVHEAAAPDPGGAEERDPQVATAAAGQAKQPAPTASTVAAAGAAPALAPSEEGAATTTEPAVEAAGEAGPACGEADEAAPSGGAVPAPGASAAAQAPPPGAALARGTAAPVQASRDPSAAATGYDDLLQGRYSPPKPSWSGLGAEEEFPSLGAAARGQRRPAAQAPAAQAPAAVPAAWGGSAWGGGAATLRSKLAAAAAPPGAGPATPPLAAAPLAGAPSPIELLEIEVGLRVPGDFTPDALRRRAVRRRTFEHRQPLLQRGRRTGNVMEGLSLHEHILSPAEQEQLVSTVDRWVELGHAGLLRGRTFTAPRKWMPGKGRITAQFGCCYNYAKDSQGREPGIIPEEVVEPLPPLLRALCARLVRWGVLPAAREPDSAIINVYDEGDCIPPHIDHLDFLRPFCTLSLCSEQPIMFAQRLVPRGPGLFVAGEGCSPALVPLPRGSCMVLDGYGGTHAMHCVPPVAARRISVTLRKMGAPHSLAVRQAVAEYEAHHRPVPRFWELADADRRAAAAAAAAGRGGIVVPLAVRCEPSLKLLAWLRCVPVRRLEFVHPRSRSSSDQRHLGFQSGEQRYRAPVATLLATLDFVRRSAPVLTVLGGVHPRPGILTLTPFTSLERLSMVGSPTETCKLEVLQGLPRLAEVEGSGFGEYQLEGLPPSVSHLSLAWGVAPDQQFVGPAIAVALPPGASLERLRLSAQRPVLLPGEALAACRRVSVAARRTFLGLPLRRDAPWADPDEVCQRFAAFLLEGRLEEVEQARRARRAAPPPPLAAHFDLTTSEGLAGQAGAEELQLCLLHRHFQALHVEERGGRAGGERPWLRIARRRSEPSGFSFPGPLTPEQRAFLRGDALASALSLGGGLLPPAPGGGGLLAAPRPAALAAAAADAEAVLNDAGFAARCGGLLASLTHAAVGPGLDLQPYSALAHLQAVWLGAPRAGGLPCLRRLQLTAAADADLRAAHFGSAWLTGAAQLSAVALARFATADLSGLRCRRGASVVLSGLVPPGGVVSAATLALPCGGFGPEASLTLRIGAPPLAQQLLAQLQAQMGPTADQVQAQAAAAAAAAAQHQAAQHQAAAAEGAGLLVQQLAEQLQQQLGAGPGGGGGAPAAPPPVQEQAGAGGALPPQVQAQPQGAPVLVAAEVAEALAAAAAEEVPELLPDASDSEDEAEEEEEEAQPWVMLPAAAALPGVAAGAGAGGVWLAAAGAGPPPEAADALAGHPLGSTERLGDATLAHDELLSAAGEVSVVGAVLRVRFEGSDLGALLHLLSARGGGACGGAARGTSAPPLRCLRLSGSSVGFVGVAAGGGAEARERRWTGPELRDWLAGSEYAGAWEAKAMRTPFRNLETVTLRRVGA